MRLVPPAVRPHVIRFGQTGALVALSVLAMAAAPVGMIAAAPEKVVEVSAPIAPPVKAVAEPAGPVTRKIVFEAPVKGYRINSSFGLRKLAIEAKARAHKGVDIAAPTGTGVFATTEGKVLRAGYQAGGYGNFIEVQHPNGMTSLYGHLSRIGLVGSTGYSTGPHLHFEVRRNGGQVDPAKIVGQSFDIRVKAPV